jgi:PAP2 superfamily
MKDAKRRLKQDRAADSDPSVLDGDSNVASPLSRRSFLGRAGSVTALALVAPTVYLSTSHTARSAELPKGGRSAASGRAEKAYQIRHEAALRQKNLPLQDHPTNDDEKLYSNKVGSFTKGLPHNQLGEVDERAYAAMVRAVETGSPADFESLPMGNVRKLANPQAAFAFALDGPDSHYLGMPAPPAFSSAEIAGEMTELYWQALTRDVLFSDYEKNSLTAAAAADLSRLSDFKGAKTSGRVTSQTLFRGDTTGDLSGPYVSQFLLKDVQSGAIRMAQRIRTTRPGDDHMFTFARWRFLQNGGVAGANKYDSKPRYIRNGRDLAEYVHRDYTYQPFLNACLMLLDLTGSRDRGNPYRLSRAQSGFSTFGDPQILDMVARIANCALRASWYQKWVVHRRVRPEEFGGRVHQHKVGAASYPIHQDILNSEVLDRVNKEKGSYLLTQAYAEGCPLHPAYPSGHAIIAGACTTVLKAYFDEDLIFPFPVEASSDGESLRRYRESKLTVGGELNKLASNIAIGRNIAGIHWRSDAVEGLKLGETLALHALAEMKGCFNEEFGGFSLTKFDGTVIHV